jgi:hypothetical protein
MLFELLVENNIMFSKLTRPIIKTVNTVLHFKLM